MATIASQHDKMPIGKLVLFFLLIPLPLIIPYFWLNHLYIWANPDSIYYINVYTSYRDALWQGEIFPHWISSANAGLGSLVFYNLSPLAYQLTAIASAPFSMLSDQQQYILGIYASQLFGQWAMWRWLRGQHGDRIALAGAALFTLVPYKWVDIYQHFTMSLCWAIAFLPLLFHGAQLLDTRDGIVNYAVAAAACFYCHALTILTVGPLALAYALHCYQWQWRRALKPLAATHLLALFLAAAYLVAMVTATAWLQIDRWSNDNFNPLHNLYHVDDFIGSYALLLMWFVCRARATLAAVPGSSSLRFWCIALTVLYVIATPLSYPLWATVPAMNIFQFPFPRLQPGMGLIVAVLGAFLLAGKRKEYTFAIIGTYVLYGILCLVHITMVYHRPRHISQLVHDVAIHAHIIPGPIHLPRWTSITENELLFGHKKYEAMSLVTVKDGDVIVNDSNKGNGWVTLHTHIESPEATMVIAQFYTPAWKATADGQPLELKSYFNGLISLQLPEGEHHLRLEVTKSLPEHIADWMTLLGLAAVAAHWGLRLGTRWRHCEEAKGRRGNPAQ